MGLSLAATPAYAASPVWNITAMATPTYLPPNSTGEPYIPGEFQALGGNEVVVTVRNLGETPVSGAIVPIRLALSLHGVTFAGPNRAEIISYGCGSGERGIYRVPCVVPVAGCTAASSEPCVLTYSGMLEPGDVVRLRVGVATGAPGTAASSATVSGGEVSGVPVASASMSQPLVVSSSPVPFGIQPGSVLAEFVGANGAPETQADAHPYDLAVDLTLNKRTAPSTRGTESLPAEDMKDLAVELPPGVAGNQFALAQCASPALGSSECSGSSQAGSLHVETSGGIGVGRVAIFNLKPDNGRTNELGLSLSTLRMHMPTTVRTDSDYGLTNITPNIPAFEDAVDGVEANVWGVPGDPSHDHERVLKGRFTEGGGNQGGGSGHPSALPPAAFFTMPSECGVPLVFRLVADSWGHPGAKLPDGSPDLSDPNWKVATVTQPPLTGCEKLQSFSPHLSVAPATTYSDTPTGTTVELAVPQGEGLTAPNALATPTLQNSKVTLPPGMVVNPGQANGLGACQLSEDGIGTTGAPSCPGDSKIGTAEIETPLLPDKLTGDVYILQSNPPNLKLLLAASGDGVNVKLIGDVHLDQATGQLTTTFTGTPALPFSHFRLTFSGGAQAALVTPPTCGVHASTADFTPWSSPATPDFLSTNAFGLTAGPAGSACASPLPFAPSMIAGASTDQAGGFTSFSLLLSRTDGEQRIGALQFKAPPGLSGLLSSVPLCPEPQAAAGTCSSSSQIGHTTVGSGAGPAPIYIPEAGHGQAPIYLTGPYKGAPFGLSIVVPVQAGPFDLGTVVTRAAISVDPQTAQVTVTTDPLPQILAGVPINLRQIDTVIDHPGFMINPTNCSPLAFSGTARSAQGADAPLSTPFRVGSCRQLRFAPKFTASVDGPTARNGNPRLRAVVSYPKGPQGTYANIAKAQVSLPLSEFLDQSHIRTICTRVQFNAGAGAGAECPPGSIYGHVRATTPLLDDPLEGPVFLRASDNTLPDLVPVLHGSPREPVVIVLDGRIDSAKGGGIRTTFEALPDAPVSKFVLEMQGGNKGLLVNSTNLCAHTNRAISEFTGQNGKLYNTNPVLTAKCGKAKKHKAKK